MSKPQVSILVPVRNEGTRLCAAIRSMVEGRSTDFPLQIVLADDASTDGCCDLVPPYTMRRHEVEIVRIRFDRWSGIPFARNQAAAAATAEILFVTDANVIFPKNWDVAVRKYIHPARVLCATIADSESSFRGYGGTLHLRSMKFHWLKTPPGSGAYVPLSPCTGTVLHAALFRRAGGYDTEMPVYGAAEPELSVRLWLSGAEIVSVPDLVLSHRFRPAQERRPFLDAITSLQVQNYLRFGLLYLEQPQIAQLLQHYASEFPAQFEAAFRRTQSGSVWQRRQILRSRLPRSFTSFAERFGLFRSASRPVNQ